MIEKLTNEKQTVVRQVSKVSKAFRGKENKKYDGNKFRTK